MAVVQSTKNGSSAGSGATVTYPAPPTPGNLMIAFVVGFSGFSAVNANWTDSGISVLDANSGLTKVLYRYVQPGDTAAQALATANSTYWGATAYEVSGVSGVWATDLEQSVTGSSTLNVFTTTNLTATHALDLALVGVQCAQAAAPIGFGSAGWTTDQAGADSGSYGYGGASQSVVNGASVQCTVSWTHSFTATYIVIILAGAGGDVQVPARLTQYPTLVMGLTGTEARLTQLPSLVLGYSNPSARLTQYPVLVLGDMVPCLTRWAQCWSIIRTDGTVFAFTDHDEQVQALGLTYSPCKSLQASANELGSIIGNIGSMDLSGVLSDDSITEVDLLAGKFDGADIEVWMFPWQNNGGETPFRLIAGIAGSCQQGILAFTMEVITPGAKLQQQSLLKSYTPQCRFTLGDARCTIDLGPLTVTGSATEIFEPLAFNQRNRRIFRDSSKAQADRYFELGTLTWLTGANAGLSSEVKSFAGGVFTLWQPSIYPILVGDTYHATPGCDLIKSTCINKFNNYINFGGFPDVPGKDAMMQVPNTKSVSTGET